MPLPHREYEISVFVELRPYLLVLSNSALLDDTRSYVLRDTYS